MAEYPDCRDPHARHLTELRITEIFQNAGPASRKVREPARRIKAGIEKISPFIQQATRTICPECKEVCCINKHGYYDFEDLVYFHALDLEVPRHESGIEDAAPCRFLSAAGCRMERTLRPSGCNWYFCDPLLDHMEKMHGYAEFDDTLREVAEQWLEMMEEFESIPQLFQERR